MESSFYIQEAIASIISQYYSISFTILFKTVFGLIKREDDLDIPSVG